MPKISRPRKGSLQFYPRKRAARFLPSVNWSPISTKEETLLGFIAYKVGMATALVKDSTEKVTTKGKQIAIPVTILEVPNMKIYSVRFYKKGKVLRDVVVSNDKELKRKIKTAKKITTLDKIPEEYDDIRIIVYSLPKQTSIKKTPDMIELAINSSDKLNFIKNLIGKEISLKDFKVS
ncbi:50S ribosomal protein L3, partial [Candidatus Pacearchaeota archaeon]|nr:50S ribosomal protein L3 [Candidatus Pacearchaeota archaeon]